MTVTATRPERTADDLDARSARIAKLNTASLRKVIEPDIDVAGELTQEMLIPVEMLSVADLGLELTVEQWQRLAREEMASVVDGGIRFEAILMSGFAEMIAYGSSMVDERTVYMLHEIGEETRHSRLFVRLLQQLRPTAAKPFDRLVPRLVFTWVSRSLLRRPAPLCVLVLAGEEIPDLLQKKMAEHPETDPFIRDVAKYHRMEEARHLAFARTVVGELWEAAGPVDRAIVKWFLPTVIRTMFDGLIQPGVYATVGLPGFRTWRAVNRTASRVALRHEAVRPVLGALLNAGVIAAGSVPRGWRALCGVDRDGVPTG